MKIQSLFAVAIATIIFVSPAFGDKVTLKSGTVVTGSAGALAGGKLSFDSDELGTLAIPVDKIVSLETKNNSHVIQYIDMSTETKNIVVANGTLAIDDAGTIRELDMTNVKEIDPTPEKWHGSIFASATVTRGNTVGESASIVGDVSRRWENDRFIAKAGYYYAASGDSKESKQKTESRFEAEAQEDHFWSKAFYSYVNAKYEFDRIMLLDYRYRLGAGLGYQWFENRDFGFGKSSFNQEIGMTYILEKYKETPEDDFGTFRYAHHYSWDIASVDGLAFAHNFEFLPQADDWTENYLIDADAGITYAFKANWNFIAKVEWDYKKRVAAGVKHSDLRYILGLGYKW